MDWSVFGAAVTVFVVVGTVTVVLSWAALTWVIARRRRGGVAGRWKELMDERLRSPVR